MSYSLDYGKLAYAKIGDIERRLEEVERAEAPAETAYLFAPRLPLETEQVKSARVTLTEDADFSVRVSMLCECESATVRVRLTVDGREAGECEESVAGTRTADFLLTVRAMERGEHALLVYLSASGGEISVTDFSLRVIGAGAALAEEDGRLSVCSAAGGDVALLLSSGRVTLHLRSGDELTPLPARFPACFDADLAACGQDGVAVVYVTERGQVFARLFCPAPFSEGQTLYLGGGATACACAEKAGTVHVLLLSGGRMYRAAVYPERGGAGRSEERETEFRADAVSLAAGEDKFFAAAASDGVVRIFRSERAGDAGGAELTCVASAQEREGG